MEWWHPAGRDDEAPILDPDGEPHAFRRLCEELERAYNAGFRRIVLQMPAGNAFGWQKPGTAYLQAQQFSMNQWYGMPAWKRSYFQNVNGLFQLWRRKHTDVTLGLYLGAPLGFSLHQNDLITAKETFANVDMTPRFLDVPLESGESAFRWVSPKYPGMSDSAYDYNPSNSYQVRRVEWTLVPWHKMGVTAFWMDDSAENVPLLHQGGGLPDIPKKARRWGQVQLSYEPYMRAKGVHFVGETIPVVAGVGGNFDAYAVKAAAWAGTEQAWKSGSNLANAVFPNYVFDRSNTEVHMMLQSGLDSNGHNIQMWQAARACRQQGGVVTIFYEGQLNNTCSGAYIDLLQRWYSMGFFYKADFNGDGLVDNQDIVDFTYAWDHRAERAVTVFATGDIDGDGKVTDADLNEFMAMMAWHQGRDPRLDRKIEYYHEFGAPDDL